MRYPRGPEHVPVGAFNRVLVTHHQRGQYPGKLPVADAFINRLAHRLAGALNRVAPLAGQLARRRVMRAGAHITRRLNALLPQPQFVVKTVRIAVAVRRFEPHRHLPALASAQPLRLALQVQRQLGRIAAFHRRGFSFAPHETRIPAQHDLRRQRHRLAIELGGVNAQAKPHRVLANLRHGQHGAGHSNVAALQRRV